MATAESAAAAAAASTGNGVGSGVGALTSLSAAVAAGSFHSLENAQGSDSAAAGKGERLAGAVELLPEKSPLQSVGDTETRDVGCES
jgi:hypothetical protein